MATIGGEWFKMSRPQRIAATVLLALIVAVVAVRLSLSRSRPLPAEVERQAMEMAAFRAAIDSAAIDTVPRPRRKKAAKPVVLDREIEDIRTH